ncbi:MAG: hypothetical protein ABWZ80_04605 [Beijerinckiaceae bacterium]
MIPRVDQSTAVSLARLIAGRDDVPEPVLQALAARGLRPRGARMGSTYAPAHGDLWSFPDDAEILPSEEAEGAVNFLTADADGRQSMIADASRFAALDGGGDLRRIDSVIALALERAAGRGDRDDVASILARALGVQGDSLKPLLADATGEALAVLLRAAGLDDSDAIRVFTGVGAETIRRGAGLQAAVRMFHTVSRPAAARLLAGMISQTRTLRPSVNKKEGRNGMRRTAANSAMLSPRLSSLSQSLSGGEGPGGETAQFETPDRMVVARSTTR